ncbi:MAG TPA: carboxypeptidase-like regulatory domain-containing protein, partial [Cytophagaceae bacterium]
MKYLLSVYLLVLLNVSFANTSDSLKVIVLDENGSGIPGVKVNIESNPTYTSNNSGVFYFVPNQKLVFPFSLNINKAGYELKEFMYYEDDGEIEIRIAQAKSQEITLKFLSDKAKPLTGLSINYKGKSYS